MKALCAYEDRSRARARGHRSRIRHARVCVRVCMCQCGNEQSSPCMQMRHFEAEWNFNIALGFLSQRRTGIREDSVRGRDRTISKLTAYITFYTRIAHVATRNEQRHCRFAISEGEIRYSFYLRCERLAPLDLWRIGPCTTLRDIPLTEYYNLQHILALINQSESLIME